MFPRALALLFTFAWLAACAAAAPERQAPSEPRGDRTSSAVRQEAPPAAASRTRPVVPVDAERGLGSRTAPLAIVEFGDYQCPHCRRFHLDTLPRLEAEFIETGKVRFFYKDFPLHMHRQAFGASVAAYCAGDQGRYWRMQQRLFAEQVRLGDALYAELAAGLDLDTARFEQCLRSDAARRAVNRDLADGNRLGVRGTPTFVLGRLDGNRVVVERAATGTPAFEAFARAIEALGR